MTYIKDNRDQYEFFIVDDEDFDKYCARLSKDGQWAGQLETRAVCDLFKVNLWVHKRDSPDLCQEFFPWGTVPTLHLSYHLEQHYNSVRRADDPGLNVPALDCIIGCELPEPTDPVPELFVLPVPHSAEDMAQFTC